jgi:ElaB/YqjD/DUF883 family membrane-anchored ribosome-binding protein
VFLKKRDLSKDLPIEKERQPWKKSSPSRILHITGTGYFLKQKRLIMEKTNTSSANITEALKLLEEAAELKNDELKNLMSDKYTHLREMIMETEKGLAQSLASVKDHTVAAAAHAQEEGVEKAREISSDVNKNVHQNPWPFIGGTAVISLLFGYILGRTPR